jgi:hypothetical protein
VDFTVPSSMTNTPRRQRMPMHAPVRSTSMPSALENEPLPSASIVILPSASCASAQNFMTHASFTDRQATRSIPFALSAASSFT